MMVISGTLLAVMAVIAVALEMSRSAAVLGALAYFLLSKSM
jgi:hypothetical protein